VPVGRSTLWRMEKAGRFPRSTYISPNRRIWFEDEIIAWQKTIAECDPHFDPARGRGKARAWSWQRSAQGPRASGGAADPNNKVTIQRSMVALASADFSRV
jgi:prophage regulatory protein